MKQCPSPNFNERAAGIALEYIVLHYTGMKDAASALARLCDHAAQVSAHYLVDENGEVTALVDENKRAWHAGKGLWRGIADMNSASIGIELVNPGHEFGYRAFPAAQIAALKNLLHAIMTRHSLSPTHALVAHSDIAPTRKQDPGELFPWQELAREGLGLWPQPSPEDFAVASEEEGATLLNNLGYDTSDKTAAVQAFQRRFAPEKLGAPIDAETIAKARALLRQRE